MSIWDEIITDDDWKLKMKEFIDSKNLAVALKATILVGEGKGFRTGMGEMDVDDVIFNDAKEEPNAKD